MPTGLITGITGQDGSYLAELLLEKGYRVVGMVRRASTENFERIAHLRSRLELRQADLLDELSLIDLLRDVRPDEVYNLAAQSFVPTSWAQPVLTAEFDAVGVTRLLQAVRLVAPEARVYQASSSEMFGRAREVPQRETTPFYPRSPYGVARIKLGLAPDLPLGNLEARRDFGFAGDYVEAMWRMLQQPEGDDYVVATGEAHSIQEVTEIAFATAGLDWRRYVREDQTLLRRAEVDHLVGDASKARLILGWQPRVGFAALIEMMVRADLEHLSGKSRGG